MVSLIPELRILLTSLLKALPQLGYIVALMFIIFHIYAAISMLTLFRVMTFEDWTDVMYETLAVYPLNWMYYLSFIFFTAFAFLNMVIGVVVNVLNDEYEKERRMAEGENQLTLEDLDRKIEELKGLIVQNRR